MVADRVSGRQNVINFSMERKGIRKRLQMTMLHLKMIQIQPMLVIWILHR